MDVCIEGNYGIVFNPVIQSVVFTIYLNLGWQHFLFLSFTSLPFRKHKLHAFCGLVAGDEQSENSSSLTCVHAHMKRCDITFPVLVYPWLNQNNVLFK
jgi:hypothetical protein